MDYFDGWDYVVLDLVLGGSDSAQQHLSFRVNVQSDIRLKASSILQEVVF